MADSRTSEICRGRWFFFFLLPFFSVFSLSFFPISPSFSAEPGNAERVLASTPDRSLQLLNENAVNNPAWRQKWQNARLSARQKKYSEAAAIYARLLEEKPELEAARWEYCQVLDVLTRYQSAGKHIETLLAFAPEKISYRLFAGKIALQNGEPEKAARNFGMVLEAVPAAPEAAVAIKGLAESLRSQGKEQLSLGLEEQLIGLREKELLETTGNLLPLQENYRRLLNDALVLRNKTKVTWLLEHLPSLASLDDAQLQAAITFLHTGKNAPQILTRAYQEQLRRSPEETSLRQRFISFLVDKGRYSEALEQFDQALEYQGNDFLLLPAASLAMGKAKSFGKALGYYRRYLQLHPQDGDAQLKIASLQSLLAKDFLAIVENGGADTLWLDMERFGRDRQEIFFQMAELLAKRGEKEALYLAAEVLQLLGRKVPENSAVGFALADVYLQLGHWSKALAALETVVPSQRRSDYYEKRADLALRQNDEYGAIEAYDRLLQFEPERDDIRQKAISLCGALGLIEQAKKFFAFYSETGVLPRKPLAAADSVPQGKGLSRHGGLNSRNLLETLQLHLFFLAENRQLDSLEEVAAWGAALWRKEPRKLLAVRLEEADALRRLGLFGAADQLLREQVNREFARDAVLLALANNAADREREGEMEQWLDILDAQIDRENNIYSAEVVTALKTLVQSRFLLRSHKPGDAAQLLKTAGISSGKTGGKKNGKIQRAIAEICQLGESIHTEKLRPFCRVHGEFPLIPWGNAPRTATLVQQNVQERSSAQLFEGKQKFLGKEYIQAQQILEPLRQKFRSSLLAELLFTDVMARQYRYSEAKELLQQLGGDAGTQCREEIRLASQAGKPEFALARFYSCYGDIDGGDVPLLAARLFAGDQPREAILLARLLWNTGQFQKALAVYRALLAVPVAEQVLIHYRQQMKNDFPGVQQEKSFWDFLSILRFSKEQQVETFDALLAPSLLMENAGSSVGIVLAGNSLLLSLQKRLIQEYDARVASYEKRYRYAEKSYKNLLSEERSFDAMSDLVAIYERMGQYQKEARLYREMEKSGRLTPVLEESMARNSEKIGPLSMVDFSLSKKKGRQHHQDIEKRYLGTSFSYLLDLDRFLNFYYGNQRYSSDSGKEVGGSNMAGVDISWQFGRNIEFSGGLGIDKENSGSDIALLYHGRVESQLDELVSGFVQVSRLEIDDTVQSLDDMLMVSTISTGLSLETPVGIGFGGDLQYNIRSDKNNGKEFHGFLTYSVFLEQSEMEITYDALYQDNDTGNAVSEREGEAASGGPVSYWSPKSYSLHTVTSRYQYDFDMFSNRQSHADTSVRRIENSFIAGELGAGIEEGTDFMYSAGIDISLEISPHCLLKGSVDFLHGQDSKEMNFFTTLQYRW